MTSVHLRKERTRPFWLLWLSRLLWLIWPSALLMMTSVDAMAVEMPFVPKQILVYGGNGLIGTPTVLGLMPTRHNIVLVSRGNWYWDSAFSVQPFVRTIKCDRMQKADKCPELMEYVDSVESFDAVIDFSAYHPMAIKETLDLLNGKAKFYIYISSDSVYEVCVKNHTDFSLETDAVRPVSEEAQANLKARESYGHYKLEGEEVLSNYRKEKNGPPYVSLRLPDVIGSRDNTYRWWIYQLWMKLQPYLEKPVSVPIHLVNKPLSFVYVEDVADLILQLVQKPPPDVYDEAFNLAIKETPSLMDVLVDIKTELNLTDLHIATTEEENAIQLFPSVHLGPVNISKAESILGWKPTAWKDIVRDTVSFYEMAIQVNHFDRARKHMIRTMQNYFTTKHHNVIRGLRNIYGLQLPEPKDEL